MKERYQELSEKGNKQSGGKQLWTYYDKMHSILGEEDTITLEHIQEVGSCHGVKKRKIHGDSGCQSKRQKSRVSNAESLERLIGIFFQLLSLICLNKFCLISDLEKERELKDEEILETLRSHKENSLIRTQAIVDMANSFKLATNAIVRKLEETNGVDNSHALVRKL